MATLFASGVQWLLLVLTCSFLVIGVTGTPWATASFCGLVASWTFLFEPGTTGGFHRWMIFPVLVDTFVQGHRPLCSRHGTGGEKQFVSTSWREEREFVTHVTVSLRSQSHTHNSPI